jgi:hypothetical protein
MEKAEDVKRAVRTALRAIEAAETNLPRQESAEHVAAAIHQLNFALAKLSDLMLQAKLGQN